MNKIINELKIDNYFSEEELQFLNEIEKIERISPKEELELIMKAQSGDMEARNRLVKANLRKVANMASKYLDKGVEFLDLIQEGSIGLINCINNFDVSKSNDFRNYAYFYIFGALRHATNQSYIIKKPEKYVNTCIKVEKITNALRMELHREPTYEEIAKEIGLSDDKVKELLFALQEVDSLDRQIDEESTLIESIPSDDDYFEEIERNQIHKDLDFIIDDATKKNPDNKDGFDILKMRCGFDGDTPKTYKELSEEFGCSQSTIWTKEAKAIRKLRRIEYRNKVSAFHVRTLF